MRAKPGFEYRLNGEYANEIDVIEFADELICEMDFDPEIPLTISEAIQIIRANNKTVKYLGVESE